MIQRPIRSILFVSLVISTLALTAYADVEPPFGPWRYFAPYYFAPNHTCNSFLLTPDQFKPRYEVPNPLVPGLPTPVVRPRKGVRGKVPSKGRPGFQARRAPMRPMRAPRMNAGRIYPPGRPGPRLQARAMRPPGAPLVQHPKAPVYAPRMPITSGFMPRSCPPGKPDCGRRSAPIPGKIYFY